MHNLTKVFALDLATHVVMSSHYHAVLYIDEKSADKWSLFEVIDPCESQVLEDDASIWRERLTDIS
ncbi:hypothetical protein ACJJI5_14805 [Microbulbifer sp. EKSA008]|uniref:hypothetical protein n=1 Tax=Microbulbifer sp. EKSA008 TaxID=3243367 RepID=UPI0040424FB6